jgi:ABC-type bacteriocin/lantibiotic exporter with double-glycine peptidase domain
MPMSAAFLRRFKPFETTEAIRPDEKLTRFAWRTSGVHQVYVGLLAVAVALLNFAPIDLQRRIVDGPISKKDVSALVTLGAVYLAVVALQATLKYALMVYQSWVSESAIKISRDQLAAIAAERAAPRASADERGASGDTVNVIGREVDAVGGFVGTSISEFVVNLTFLIVIAAYMLYMQPMIALVSAAFLAPQMALAPYMQGKLNTLFERQVGLVRKLGDETVRQAASDPNEPGDEYRTIVAIYRNRLRFYFLKYGLKTLLNVANAMGPLTVLVVGGYMVIHDQTTIGTVVAFVSGFERLSGPLRDLLNFYRDYEQAKVQHKMITRWIADSGRTDGAARVAEPA